MDRLSLVAVIAAIIVAWCAAFPAKAGPYSEVEVPALEYHTTTVWPEYQDDPWWMGNIIHARGDIDRCIANQMDWIPVDANQMPKLDPGPQGSCLGTRREWVEYRGHHPNFGFGPVHGTAWRLYPGTVPEPGSLALLGVALVALFAWKKP